MADVIGRCHFPSATHHVEYKLDLNVTFMRLALRIAGQKHVLSVRDGIIQDAVYCHWLIFSIFAYLPIPGDWSR